MEKTEAKKIIDLKKGDRVKGIYAIMQVISNNAGILYFYNELTGIFFETDCRRYVKNGGLMEVVKW